MKQYNATRNLDHGFEKDREHGIVTMRKQESGIKKMIMVDANNFKDFYNLEDFKHVIVVRNIAIILNNNIGKLDESVLQYACLLHDCGKKIKKKQTTTCKHEVIGADYFLSIKDQVENELLNYGASKETVDRKIKCIYCAILFHSSVMSAADKNQQLWDELNSDEKTIVICVYAADTIAKAFKNKNRYFGKWIKKDIVDVVYKRINSIDLSGIDDSIKKKSLLLLDLITNKDSYDSLLTFNSYIFQKWQRYMNVM